MIKLLIFILVPLAACCQCLAADMLDLAKAVVVAPANATRQEQKATQMLVEEIAARTQIQPLITQNPADNVPAIRLENSKAGPAEGYRISIDSSGAAPKITVAGNDSRGLLFGVGRLLRTL